MSYGFYSVLSDFTSFLYDFIWLYMILYGSYDGGEDGDGYNEDDGYDL